MAFFFSSLVQNHCHATDVCGRGGECFNIGSTYRCRCNFFYQGKKCEKCSLKKSFIHSFIHLIFLFSEFKSNSIVDCCHYYGHYARHWLCDEIRFVYILSLEEKVRSFVRLFFYSFRSFYFSSTSNEDDEGIFLFVFIFFILFFSCLFRTMDDEGETLAKFIITRLDFFSLINNKKKTSETQQRKRRRMLI